MFIDPNLSLCQRILVVNIVVVVVIVIVIIVTVIFLKIFCYFLLNLLKLAVQSGSLALLTLLVANTRKSLKEPIRGLECSDRFETPHRNFSSSPFAVASRILARHYSSASPRVVAPC